MKNVPNVSFSQKWVIFSRSTKIIQKQQLMLLKILIVHIYRVVTAHHTYHTLRTFQILFQLILTQTHERKHQSLSSGFSNRNPADQGRQFKHCIPTILEEFQDHRCARMTEFLVQTLFLDQESCFSLYSPHGRKEVLLLLMRTVVSSLGLHLNDPVTQPPPKLHISKLLLHLRVRASAYEFGR